MSIPCSVVPFAEVDGVCDGCGKKLVGKQRNWCGPTCVRAYRTQHHWTLARAAAKRRDGYRCRHCGTGRENPSVRLEVNHVTPRLGKGYAWGCWNHLDGLETLCRTCHQKVTNQQKKDRKATK